MAHQPEFKDYEAAKDFCKAVQDDFSEKWQYWQEFVTEHRDANCSINHTPIGKWRSGRPKFLAVANRKLGGLIERHAMVLQNKQGKAYVVVSRKPPMSEAELKLMQEGDDLAAQLMEQCA